MSPCRIRSDPIGLPYLQATGGGPVVLGELDVKGDVQVTLIDGALEVGHTLANDALDLPWLDHASCRLFYVDAAAIQVCQQNFRESTERLHQGNLDFA